MSEDTEGRRPNPVDLHVGGRVRMRRKLMGVSQEQLADSLGLTFQQVQKYERGANRVSASMMWEIAQALEVSPGYFFQGLPGRLTEETPADRELRAFFNTAQGHDLGAIAAHLPEPLVRAHIALMQMQVGALTAAVIDTAERKMSDA